MFLLFLPFYSLLVEIVSKVIIEKDNSQFFYRIRWEKTWSLDQPELEFSLVCKLRIDTDCRGGLLRVARILGVAPTASRKGDDEQFSDLGIHKQVVAASVVFFFPIRFFFLLKVVEIGIHVVFWSIWEKIAYEEHMHAHTITYVVFFYPCLFSLPFVYLI